MRSKHTEGPWEIDSSHYDTQLLVVGNEGHPIAEVECNLLNTIFGFTTNPTKQQEANARLIAAAPEMLAMLHQWVDAMDCHCNLQGLCMMCETEKLIAKAEGE
jgi:hypothetical protein